MKRLILATLLVALSALSASAQLRYAVTGRYNKLSAQGMAICGDRAYLYNKTGYCRVLSLKTSKIVAEFPLGCYGEKNHANSGSFGCEIPSGSEVPAMYVSECGGEYRCFVERVMSGSSDLIQTINVNVTVDGKRLRMIDWVADRDNRNLYGIAHTGDLDDGSASKVYTIYRFRLPELKEGARVTFGEGDILGSFTVAFPNLIQGASIRGKYLYIAAGLHEEETGRPDHGRAIIVADLKKGLLTKIVDLTLVTVNEPEDLDFYGGKALLYCGQSGGLYQLKL